MFYICKENNIQYGITDRDWGQRTELFGHQTGSKGKIQGEKTEKALSKDRGCKIERNRFWARPTLQKTKDRI